MTFADISEKFRHCCQYSVKPIPRKNQGEAIQLVKKLEEVDDVSQIVRLLA
jgi:hypothetical protein